MQPGVTVALATVWLVVAAAGVVEAVTPRPLRFSHDQYSPASPRRHDVQRDQSDWRDHDLVEDQPLDLWIALRRSIFAEESPSLSRDADNSHEDISPRDAALSKQAASPSGWQKWLPNIAGSEFASDKVDYGEMPGTPSRKMPLSDPDDLFVADDTFQDQGPGSVEIYKLDLSKEKVLLTATSPTTNLPARNKSKAPKKTDRVNSKAKTMEVKSTSPKTHHRQSNFFEEQRTEMPINRDAFGVGGVPELQVGCEGLEASYKVKRSIGGVLDKQEGEVPVAWLNVTPINLDFDYDLSYDDEGYEEMDELFRLKKLEETTTKKVKPNRGDMDATLNFDHLDDSRRPEKLPIRGDLGESIVVNSSGLVDSPPRIGIDQDETQKLTDFEVKEREKVKTKQEHVSPNGDSSGRSHGRRLLWLAEANTTEFAGDERERAKRSIDWGFGENEGVVSSDELQTVNERRRQHEMRYHQDARRRSHQRKSNSEVDTIRRDYERLLEQKRREEEERLRRMQQSQRTPNRWEDEEANRRDEMRRRQYEEYYKKMGRTSTPRTYDEEMQRRQMEAQRRQEMTHNNQMQETARRNEEEKKRRDEEQRRQLREEEISRRGSHDTRQEEQRRRQEENARRSGSRTPMDDEERRRRLHDEEMRKRAEDRRRHENERRRLQEEEIRRQEQYRAQEQTQRRKEEDERRRTNQRDPARDFSQEDRRRLEERHRQWQENRRQEDENERRSQQARDSNEVPSNLMRAVQRVGHPNDLRQRDRDQERQMRELEERMREQKLREYIARNRPINVNQADRRSEEERRRYRPEQSMDSRTSANRDDEEYRGRVEEQRRRQEEELQDYIRRNQPVNVPSRSNQSVGRNWLEERRLIEETRQRGRYPDSEAARRHGPSAPTYIDSRGSLEEVRRRQEARRLEEERRQARERQQRYDAEERRKELARREAERKLQEERRKEVARREEEARRTQSTRYEEDRKRLETSRIQDERRRQEVLRERARDGRTRQPETMRSPYQNTRLAEHRRRQDSQPIPSNLMRDEARRAAERQRQERARLEAERRLRQENWMREERQREERQREAHGDQWRRQELVRLHALPVKARIIVRPGGGDSSSSNSQVVISRAGFGNEVDFMGINPNRKGVQVKFPAPPTSRPPVESPKPCVWAIVQCCSRNNNRLLKCFESMGCPGISWDANPCRQSIMESAKAEVMKFYAAAAAP